MIDPWLRRAATCVLFTSAAFLAGAAPPTPATSSPVLQGNAFVRAEGGTDFAPAAEATELATSMGVRTGANASSSVRIGDGVTLRVAPSSTFVVRPPLLLPAVHPGASPVHAFQLQLSEGEVDLESHDPASALGFLVMLPGGRSVALWHGSANVAIHGDDVMVALYEGMAITGVAQQWKPMQSHTGVVLREKTVSPAHPVPGAPSWFDTSSTPPFALVRGDERAVVGCEWGTVPEAASYRVETGTDLAMNGALAITQTNVPSMKTDPLAPGSYFVRVRAISAEGIVGPASPAKGLRVARLSLPAMAFAAPGGAVVLASSQAVTLDDPRGIEVATASDFDPHFVPRWVPASSELTLGGNEKRTLLIRHASSHVQSKLLLVRRELHARVSFNPPHPRWPDSPVDVTVKVEDPSGYLDPAREAVSIDVLVDLDKPQLTWTHRGDTWTARVPPRSPPGPWVVRVNVQDRAGIPIGASLLDVDGPASLQPLERAKYQEQEGELHVVR